MSTLELRHLRYFVAVAEEEHFGRAAERIGIAQPPLTQQIQKLEMIVGERLLDRRPRVRLTSAGQAFLTAARQALGQAEEAVTIARRAASGAYGSLTVGFPASSLLTIVPEAVRRYRECFPDVELKLLEMSTALQITALTEGTLDVGFLRQPPNELADLKWEFSFAERLCVALPADHRLGARGSVELAELAEDPFVLFPQIVAPGLYLQVYELCRRAGFTPRVMQEAREWLTIVGLVDAGVGLSIVPASFRRLQWGGVLYVDLSDPDVATTVSVFSAAGGSGSTAQRFAEIARAVLEETRELDLFVSSATAFPGDQPRKAGISKRW